MDILLPDGSKRTLNLAGMDQRGALTYALEDIDRRWEFYKERYRRAMKR